MVEFKTLHFPNTASGQAQKGQTLAREVALGWKVVSETVTQGKFRGGDACCLFMICAPFAFLAGSSDGTINVTLQRDSAATESSNTDTYGTPNGGGTSSSETSLLQIALLVVACLIGFAFFVGLLASLSGVPPGTSSLPPQAARKLDLNAEPFRNIAAVRDGSSSVVVVADTSLPPGTRIVISLFRKDQKQILSQSETVVDGNFHIRSARFQGNFATASTPQYMIELTARFGPGSQTPEVLWITGNGGSHIPKRFLVPDRNLSTPGSAHVEGRVYF